MVRVAQWAQIDCLIPSGGTSLPSHISPTPAETYHASGTLQRQPGDPSTTTPMPQVCNALNRIVLWGGVGGGTGRRKVKRIAGKPLRIGFLVLSLGGGSSSCCSDHGPRAARISGCVLHAAAGGAGCFEGACRGSQTYTTAHICSMLPACSPLPCLHQPRGMPALRHLRRALRHATLVIFMEQGILYLL